MKTGLFVTLMATILTFGGTALQVAVAHAADKSRTSSSSWAMTSAGSIHLGSSGNARGLRDFHAREGIVRWCFLRWSINTNKGRPQCRLLWRGCASV